MTNQNPDLIAQNMTFLTGSNNASAHYGQCYVERFFCVAELSD